MKKLLSIILTLLLLISLIGCDKPTEKKDESSKAQETLVVEKTESIKKNQADKQVTVTKGTAQKEVEENTENTQPDVEDITKPQPVQSETVQAQKKAEPEVKKVLSAEDKVVKAEIAKHSDTKVDFRYNKNEIIQDKSYDISFAEFSSSFNPSKIIYKNQKGDIFEYDIETGKLCNVTIKSNIVEKSANSIDINMAHEFALKYFPVDCDITEYTNDVYKETKNGYSFWYTRYIGKYKTTDAFRINIGFDGAIIDINDATDVFEKNGIAFNEAYIDSKIQEYVEKNKNIEVGSVIILINNGKICVDLSCKKTLSNGGVSAYHVMISLE